MILLFYLILHHVQASYTLCNKTTEIMAQNLPHFFVVEIKILEVSIDDIAADNPKQEGASRSHPS